MALSAQFVKYLKEIWWKLEEKIWLRCHFNAEKMALFDFNLDSDEKSDFLLKFHIFFWFSLSFQDIDSINIFCVVCSLKMGENVFVQNGKLPSYGQ